MYAIIDDDTGMQYKKQLFDHAYSHLYSLTIFVQTNC